MIEDTDKIIAAKRNAKRVLLLCLLLAIPISIYFIFFAFDENDNVSGHGYAAHVIGVILAFLSAFLFMGITFFSARSGYDEQPNYREMAEQQSQKQQDTQIDQ